MICSFGKRRLCGECGSPAGEARRQSCTRCDSEQLKKRGEAPPASAADLSEAQFEAPDPTQQDP
jgi:hypothetical protein